ncbi:MAG: hypothetical protein ACLP1X_01355 [Polyangiaceae bacterium]
MPRPKSANDTTTSLNCPGDWLDLAQEIATQMSKETGVGVMRADVLRLALKRGLDVLKAEHPSEGRRRRGG